MKAPLPRREDAEDRRSTALMGVIVCLVLLVAALFLVQEIGKRHQLDNCLLAGRRDCVPAQLLWLDTEPEAPTNR